MSKLTSTLGFFFFGQAWQIRRAFHAISGKDRLIDYSEWKKALGIKNSLTSRRMFELVDTDNSGYIDYDEFSKFIITIIQRNIQSRLAFVFKVYDLDGDGYITTDEAKQILQSSLAEQDLSLVDDDISELAGVFIRAIDRNRDHKICAEDFVKSVSRFPGIEYQLDQFANMWVPTKFSHKSKRVVTAGWLRRLKRRLSEIQPNLYWIIIFAMANIFVISVAVERHIQLGSSYGMIVARAGGAALNLNMALVLIPMFRALWGYLRHTFINHLIKIDKMVDYHKAIGYSIVIFTLIHIAGHLANYKITNQSIGEALIHTSAGLTGLLITIAFLIMLSGVWRRQSNREWFALSHLLYGAFIAGLLLHGPVFWLWFALTGSLLAIESLMRYFLKTRRMKVIELKSLAEGVTAITLNKPKRMRFYPGDFVRLQLPAVSSYEWHPFTISAAPEAPQFAVHVRNNGDWSGALHNLARKKPETSKRQLTARIDGPYSAPTSMIYRSSIAVLVAGGIGVTPFASVLQSILLQDKNNRSKSGKKQLIYFHWLNRSQKSYEWFVDLLSNAEEQLGSDRFQLSIHLTSLSHNLTNIAMQIALEAYRRRYNRDPLTRLKAVTSAGRPDWEEIFSDLALQHPDELVDVYFCGPPELALTVKSACRLQGFHFHQERFD
jgi:predicted ferric reductase/Ca2+-binding EF-hand superfamily protein